MKFLKAGTTSTWVNKEPTEVLLTQNQAHYNISLQELVKKRGNMAYKSILRISSCFKTAHLS